MLSTLGPHAKYSSCLYPTGDETLAEAEECMLESYCWKAQLRDGMEILDLGCGMTTFISQTQGCDGNEDYNKRMGESFSFLSQGS